MATPGYGVSVTVARSSVTRMAAPVVLVHGWGGSFRNTWQKSGFTACGIGLNLPAGQLFLVEGQYDELSAP